MNVVTIPNTASAVAAIAADISALRVATAGGAGAIFTYREGATDDPPRGLYGAFSRTYAAAYPSRPCTILVDPAGGTGSFDAAYDISAIRIVGGDGSTAALTALRGASFTGDVYYFNNVVINQNGADPIISVSSLAIMTLDNDAGIQGGAGTTAISVTGTGQLAATLGSFGFLYTNSDTIMDVGVSAQASIFCLLGTSIASNTIGGTGDVLIQDVPGIAMAGRNTSLSGTQINGNVVFGYG